MDDASSSVASDLLKEKSLWDIYKKARGIPVSKLNKRTGICVGVATFAFSIYAATPSPLINQLMSISSIAFNATISLLGFLIAGFSFFATVADKKMFCRMAEVQHKASGLSYLKYNLFVFMKIFCEYGVFCFVLFLVPLLLSADSVFRAAIKASSEWLLLDKRWVCIFRCDVIIAAGALAIVIGGFCFLLLELKSFIFNVYHIVMSSVRWALEDEPSKN